MMPMLWKVVLDVPDDTVSEVVVAVAVVAAGS